MWYQVAMAGRIGDDDAPLVVASARLTMGFVASLPVVVTHADVKPLLPEKASTLAVKKVGSETVYIGSFDMLLRVHCYRAGPWKTTTRQWLHLM